MGRKAAEEEDWKESVWKWWERNREGGAVLSFLSLFLPHALREPPWDISVHWADMAFVSSELTLWTNGVVAQGLCVFITKHQIQALPCIPQLGPIDRYLASYLL